MPYYKYYCEEHGDFEKLVKVSEHNKKQKCPECDKMSEYVPSFATARPVFKGSGFHCNDYNVKEGS